MFTDNDMDSVFQALAHSTRRKMLDILHAKPGIGVGQLAQEFDVSRIAIMNHLNVLEKANLITSEKDGRTRRLYLNVMPIQDIQDRWMDRYSATWAERMNTIKQAAQGAAQKMQEDP